MAADDHDETEPAGAETDRPALPPGDPASWQALVAGTWLAGTTWPGWASPTPYSNRYV